MKNVSGGPLEPRRRRRDLAETDAAGLSGGEDGLTVSGIPELLNVNVRQDGLYWLALATLVAVLGALFVRTSTPLLDELAGTGTVQDLADPVERAVTSQPLILGVVYMLFVLFLPGGLVALGRGRFN